MPQMGATGSASAFPRRRKWHWQSQWHTTIAIAAVVTMLVAAMARGDGTLAARQEAALRAAADHVVESVVQIRTIGGVEPVGGALSADGPTTGLVISADGYIVSSAFNFAQPPASILVTFASGKQVPAELVATDHSRMLVLIKVAGAADLPVPTLAPTEEIRVGQWAIAVGRTFRADRTNVSVGIVSATGRMFGKVLQTDADASTANYGGPLVDIRGRVLGVIVPMAPQGTSEVAGVEWYDSGIGFAVPLSSIAERLERMKQGEDQRSGILGIGLTRKNPHSSSAELAVVRPDSPAGQAGLKKGDQIIELDGKPIRTQTDLRFALGPRYGGDTVRIIAQRGDERLERTITLAGELAAFRHAFLGILPMRPVGESAKEYNKHTDKDDQAAQGGDAEDLEANEAKTDAGDDRREAEQGVAVRMVYTGSPAAEAGIQIGDRVVRMMESELHSSEDAIEEMNNVAPGNKVAVRVVRDGQPMDLTLEAARLPTSVPSELPPATAPSNGVGSRGPTTGRDTNDQGGPANDRVKTEDSRPLPQPGETRELKLPEFPETCQVYEPASFAAGRAVGVLLWLHAPGEANADEVIRQWQPICDRDGLLLVVPTAAEADRWERTELEYLRRLTERVVGQYKIDPQRVVVYGRDGGGAMAWLLGLSGRDVFRGVASSAAPLPRQVRVPANETSQRLAIFAAIPPTKDTAAQIAQGLQKLADAGYPVTTITTVDSTGRLSDAERNELARWIDTLDRF